MGDNVDIVNQIKEQVKREVDTNQVDELIKNNATEFEHKGVTYKVGLPSFSDKQKAYEVKVEKFTELLQDKRYKLQADLKKIWMERGIDIDAITAKINTLEGRKADLDLKLGALLKDKAPEEDCKALRDEIQAIKLEQYDLSIEKTDYLQYSIESQVLISVYRYLTYAVTKKKIGEVWVKAWDSYQQFLEAEDELVNKVSFYVSLITGPM